MSTIPIITIRAGETRRLVLDVSLTLPEGVDVSSAGTLTATPEGALEAPPALALGSPVDGGGEALILPVTAPVGAAGETYRLALTWTTDGGEVVRSLLALRVV